MTNEAEHDLLFYYYVDLELHQTQEEGMGRFHAQYRQSHPRGMSDAGLTNEEYLFGGENVAGKENYTILEAEGRGHYVGVLFSVYSRRRYMARVRKTTSTPPGVQPRSTARPITASSPPAAQTGPNP